MQFAFDSTNGLGMSILRMQMPYDGVWRLDSAKATVWCIQQARSFGAKILMTPWSPPEWMKTHNRVYGNA